MTRVPRNTSRHEAGAAAFALSTSRNACEAVPWCRALQSWGALKFIFVGKIHMSVLSAFFTVQKLGTAQHVELRGIPVDGTRFALTILGNTRDRGA
jgi:hypothetical protein